MAGGSSAILNNQIRTFVVEALARFDTPGVVAAAVKKEFGIEIARQSIEYYDPTTQAGRNLAPKWRTLFELTRQKFRTDLSSIGISERAVRLRGLDRMAKAAEEKGNMVLAAQLYEQAAKEMGGSFTNRHEHTGKDGKDLPASQAPVVIFQVPDNGRG